MLKPNPIQAATELCPEFPRAAFPNIESLPIQVTEVPQAAGFPEFHLSPHWLAESGITALVGLLLFVGWYFLRQNRTKPSAPVSGQALNVSRMRSSERSIGEWILLVGGFVFCFSATGHGVMTKLVEKEIHTAAQAFDVKDYNHAHRAVGQAKTYSKLTPLLLLSHQENPLALHRPPFKQMQEAVGTQAIIESVPGMEAPAIQQAMDFFRDPSRLVTDQAKQAVLYGWSALGNLALAEENFDDALGFSKDAFLFDRLDKGDLSESNYCRARYHYALAQIDAGNPGVVTKFIRSLEETNCHFDDSLRVLLNTYHARTLAALALETGEPPGTLAAIKHLDVAHTFSQKYEHPYPYITCDLAAALDAHALALLSQENAAEAVRYLDRSDALLPQREFILKLRPQALLMWAYGEMNERHWHKAINILTRAEAEPLADKASVRDALVSAYQSLGVEAQETQDLDQAIAWYEKAHQLNPRDRSLQNNLGQAHLVRGEDRLKEGLSKEAKNDFRAAKTRAPGLATSADLFLKSLDRGQLRLQQLNSIPGWIKAPAAVGMSPKDIDEDGRIDHYAFFSKGRGQPVAFAEAKSMGKVYLTDGKGRVTTLLRNHDGRGGYDERTDYGAENANQMMVDLDNDHSPDVKRLFADKETYSDKPLSGRIVMVMKSGVIGTGTDFAGEPDAYVKLFKNQAYLGKTDTAKNTFHPIWNQGIVVDYKFGDNIKIEVWDEDPLFDDFIDYYRVKEFPTKGIYQFQERKAAIDIDIRPSTLDEGHQQYVRTPTPQENVFRDFPTQVPQVSDIIAGAQAAEKAAQFQKEMSVWVASNILIPRIFPMKNVVGVMLRNQIAKTILESAMNLEPQE